MLFSPQILVINPPKIVVAAGATTTLNPSDKSANITLTGGNLIATNSGAGNGSVRSVASYSSGKFYCEVSVGAVSTGSFSRGIGFGNASASLSALIGTPDVNSGGIYNGGGTNFFRGGSNVAGAPGYGNSQNVGMAFDIGNSTIWFRTNGGNWNANAGADPATNTAGLSTSSVSGPFFFMLFEINGGTENTVNFGATAYSFTAPSGFSNW